MGVSSAGVTQERWLRASRLKRRPALSGSRSSASLSYPKSPSSSSSTVFLSSSSGAMVGVDLHVCGCVGVCGCVVSSWRLGVLGFSRVCSLAALCARGRPAAPPRRPAPPRRRARPAARPVPETQGGAGPPFFRHRISAQTTIIPSIWLPFSPLPRCRPPLGQRSKQRGEGMMEGQTAWPNSLVSSAWVPFFSATRAPVD